MRGLAVVSFFALSTVFFNWNGLFYREVQWVAEADGFYHVSITYGPLYVVFLFSRVIIPYTVAAESHSQCRFLPLFLHFLLSGQ